MVNAEYMQICFKGMNVMKFSPVGILMCAIAELYMFGNYSETVKTWEI